MDKNLKYSLLGIKIALIAIIVQLCSGAISMFLGSTIVPPFVIGIIYLALAIVLFYFLIKIKTPAI